LPDALARPKPFRMPSERWTKKKRDQLDSLLTFAPDNQQLSWPDVDHLDQERLWWSMRGLDRAGMMVLLARALAKVPASQLESVCRDYFFAGDIGGVSTHVELDLCAAVHRFCRFSKAGHFYEYMDYRGSEQSDGTHNFCARCQSTFERCVAESETTDPALVGL